MQEITNKEQNEKHLKGPKLEIFVAEFFTQTKPLWVDD
jgi:hypothetical protein